MVVRLRILIELTSGKLKRQRIPAVYGAKLAAATDAEGVLKAQPKQIKRAEFGNLIHLASLYVNRNRPNSIVLTEKSSFRVQCTIVSAAKINIGMRFFFGTTRAAAERFLTSHYVVGVFVVGVFDLVIPVNDLQTFRGRGNNVSPVGLEVCPWFCVTSNKNSNCHIEHSHRLNQHATHTNSPSPAPKFACNLTTQ